MIMLVYIAFGALSKQNATVCRGECLLTIWLTNNILAEVPVLRVP